MSNKGLSIHCHHEVLIEYCWDYDERVEAIKRKPLFEQETRLRLFKMLPDEALKDIPLRLQKAYAEWEKAYAERVKAKAEWEKAYAERVKAKAEWEKAYTEWEKAKAEWRKAYAEREKAYAEWKKADRDAFHKKWCGCKCWNGKEIVFKK